MGLQPSTSNNDMPVEDEMSAVTEQPSQPQLNAATDSLKEQAKVHNMFDQRKAPHATNGLCFSKQIGRNNSQMNVLIIHI